MQEMYNSYDKEFKLKAVDMYINKNIGATTIAKKLGLRSKSQVYRWVKKFEEKGETAFDEDGRNGVKHSRAGRPKTKFSSAEEELQYLRMENEFLKKLKALRGK
jgi:transposase-like protein